MTLIVTVNGPESIWLLADRRITYAGRPPKDDARKIMFLETTDGAAILGYAGLGETAGGTEPADWMSAVLRGRNLPLEQSLSVLAEAVRNQLPRHMLNLPPGSPPIHTVMAPAFVGNEARIYTIDLALSPDRSQYRSRHTRHVLNKPTPATPRTPRLGVAGSGTRYLMRDTRWMRRLIKVVAAHDRKVVSTLGVADHLAKLNHEVHLAVADGSVGPRCIVAWRHRKGGVHEGGGAQQFYTATVRDDVGAPLPTIGQGMDIQAIVGLLMPNFLKRIEMFSAGQPHEDPNFDELNAKAALLPDKPDEDLR